MPAFPLQKQEDSNLAQTLRSSLEHSLISLLRGLEWLRWVPVRPSWNRVQDLEESVSCIQRRKNGFESSFTTKTYDFRVRRGLGSYMHLLIQQVVPGGYSIKHDRHGHWPQGAYIPDGETDYKTVKTGQAKDHDGRIKVRSSHPKRDSQSKFFQGSLNVCRSEGREGCRRIWGHGPHCSSRQGWGWWGLRVSQVLGHR